MQQEQLDLYADLFVGRRDDHGIQQPDGRYRRVGLPLDQAALARHLGGQESLATYVMDERGHCRFAVFDADDPDLGLPQLVEVQAKLANDGCVSYLEQSRRGGHLWVFLAGTELASRVRDRLLPYCPSNVEFYPKQEEGGLGVGSLIRLPLGVHRKTGRRYPFVEVRGGQGQPVQVAGTIREQLIWLAGVQRVQLPQTVRSAQIPKAGDQAARSSHQSLAKTSHQRYASIQEWNADQDPRAVIGRYVRLDAHGLGCCPFGEHHRDGKDTHPSLRVYKSRSASASSWYCYTWQRGGNVFDFLCLYYRLPAADLWRHLQLNDYSPFI